MFKQRLLTALMLIPLVLLAIYNANTLAFNFVVLLLVAVSGIEWLQLIPMNRLISKLLFILVLLSVVFLSVYWFHAWLMVGIVLWGLILLAVLTFPASVVVWGNRIWVGGACFVLLPLFASSLFRIYQQPFGKDLIVYLLFLVWATDTGAYLAGKFWGRHKLIPRVSPGKTVEGFLGGVFLAMCVAALGFLYFNPRSHLGWYAVALGTALLSMVGDLFISMLKRRSKLKDTGHVLPGHGGILDRLDSLIAASPVFYFGLLYLF